MNWRCAEQVLAAVLPGSAAFDHDRISGIAPGDWELFDLEDRGADLIDDDVLSRCADLVGPLVIVNDVSFDPDQGPDFVDAADLAEFVRTFSDRVRDYFVHPSLFIVAPVSGVVIIVQDDGYLATVRGRSVSGPTGD